VFGSAYPILFVDRDIHRRGVPGGMGPQKR
jgi:hypothetical protein